MFELHSILMVVTRQRMEDDKSFDGSPDLRRSLDLLRAAQLILRNESKDSLAYHIYLETVDLLPVLEKYVESLKLK